MKINKKYTLSLDTSSEKGFIALLDGAKVLFSKELDGMLHSSNLMPEIKNAFASLKIHPNNISVAAVGIGPGSYTGIRVAVAFAKSFAFARQIPLIGFSALTGFVTDKDASFASLIDAKIGGFYFISGTKKEGSITHTSLPQLISMDKLLPKIENIKTIITPNKNAIETKLTKHFPNGSWEIIEKFPDVNYIATIIHQKQINKDFSLDGKLDLMYLRSAQAEIEKKEIKNERMVE